MENRVANQLPEVDSLPDGFVDSSMESVAPQTPTSEQEKPVSDCKEDSIGKVDHVSEALHELAANESQTSQNGTEKPEKMRKFALHLVAEPDQGVWQEEVPEASVGVSRCSEVIEVQRSSQSSDRSTQGGLDSQATGVKEISSSESTELQKGRKVEATETKPIVVRDKLESLCRELQRQNKMLMDECKRVSTEGQHLRLDLSTKFQDAIKDVSNRLEEQKEESLTQLKENEMLRKKLKEFADQYAISEQQNAQKIKQHEEKLAQEQSQMKIYAEQVSQLLATEKNLRLQVTADGDKFQQFQEALVKSNEVFETFKQEIDKMAKSIKELKKENTFLKSKCEKSDVMLIELREKLKKQLDKTRNQKEKLESLCRSLQAERKQNKTGSNSSDSNKSDNHFTRVRSDVGLQSRRESLRAFLYSLYQSPRVSKLCMVKDNDSASQVTSNHFPFEFFEYNHCCVPSPFLFLSISSQRVFVLMEMNLVASCKSSRIFYPCWVISKQGKKQDLMDRVLGLLSDDEICSTRSFVRKQQIGKEAVVKIIDDAYRKMQITDASDLAVRAPSGLDTMSVKEEVEDFISPEKRIRCPCGSSLPTEFMIQCIDSKCQVQQHISCVIPVESDQPIPPVFYCETCRIDRADPFWVTEAHLTLPVKLKSSNISMDGIITLQNVETTFQLTRSDQQLLQNCEYDVQAWCMLLNDNVLFRMQWPLHADLQSLGANGRDDGAQIKLCIREGMNRISLSRRDSRVFCFGIRLVKRRTVEQVLNLIPKVGESFEDSLARVCRCFGGGMGTTNEDSDSDLEVIAEAITVNLRCPMSGSRMKIAGRFKPCAHVGCFDLETFVKTKSTLSQGVPWLQWQCPICLKNYCLEDIVIDPYFNRITTMMGHCEEDITEIEVKPDGSWTVKTKVDIGDLRQWHFPDGSLCALMMKLLPVTKCKADREGRWLESTC
ncbi:hypothetical protein NC652_027004 [Populus alba x Populus x berolinensis]|nr:hypothetical protein NC652_027004 [Populus alba x Populus x berolinensis]